MYVVVVIFCVLGLLVRSSSTQGFTSFFGITREKFDTTNNPEIIRHLPFILFNFFFHMRSRHKILKNAWKAVILMKRLYDAILAMPVEINEKPSFGRHSDWK